METPPQMCARLVTALEDLAAQETASLEARDFSGAIAVQDRAAPLVDLLVAHAADVTDRAVRDRIAVMLARRNRTGEWLADQIEKVRQELQQTDVAQRRVAQIAPVYGQSEGATRGQLCAVG